MATLTPVVQEDAKRKDQTWNVKIRLGHKSKVAFIDTTLFVVKKQLDKDHKIKDSFVIAEVVPKIKEYQQKIKELGVAVDSMNANQLKASLLLSKPDTGYIDFLKFAHDHIEALKKAGKIGSAKNLSTVYFSLQDYFKEPVVLITDINYSFLVKYEAYLRTTRRVIRRNHSGATREYVLKPIGDAGLHTHMRDLRLMFNEARNQFNDEDTGVMKIFHYPFKKYKVGSAPLTEHRNRTIAEMIILRDTVLPEGTRGELARDLCMLSFYLCGMNAADLYELTEKPGARIEYCRAKTRAKRKDNAFISVKVVTQAKPLLKKYAGKLQKRYSSMYGLNSAIDKGLQEVSKITGIENLDFYSIRHTFASLASNKCGVSTEDVAIALNQKERTVTDIYIEQDWSKVDRVQKKVLALF